MQKKTPAQKSKTIYIGNLHYKIDEKNLRGIFGKYGKVKWVKLVKEPKSDKSQGIAFVEMFNSNDAERAIKKLDGSLLDGRTIKVSEAAEKKSFIPPIKITPPKEKKIIPRKKLIPGSGLKELFKNTKKK